VLRGNDQDAPDLYRRALGAFRDLGDREDIAVCLEGLAEVAARREQAQRAAEIFGAADTLRGLGTALSLPTLDPVVYKRRIDALRSRLGDEPFGTAWARGRAMTLEQACEFALSSNEGER
jgi:hypothetical protein